MIRQVEPMTTALPYVRGMAIYFELKVHIKSVKVPNHV